MTLVVVVALSTMGMDGRLETRDVRRSLGVGSVVIFHSSCIGDSYSRNQTFIRIRLRSNNRNKR